MTSGRLDHNCDEDFFVKLTAARDPRWNAALHEAGHAVAALRLGLDLTTVEIECAYVCRAMPKVSDSVPHSVFLTLDPSDEVSDAVYTLAGEMAEAYASPDGNPSELSASDREYFAKLGPGKPDRHELSRWRLARELDAETLVCENWKSIRRVAIALMQKGRLSGNEVRHLLGL